MTVAGGAQASQSPSSVGEELAEGWARAKVGDVLQINYGKGLTKADRTGGPVPVYGSNGGVGDHNVALTNGPTIVLGRKGSVGAVHYSPVACWPIDTTYFIDRFDGVDAVYLTHALRSLNLAELDTSTAIPGLNRDDVYGQTIPLPPVAEQRRIVAKVEELLARVNAARERLAKVPAVLKRFRQAVLAAACSGRLTADWREDQPGVESASQLLDLLRQTHERNGSGHGGKAAPPTEGVHTLASSEFPDTWALAELKWLCEPGSPITYGILKPGPNQYSGIPYIRVVDFPDDRLHTDGIRRTTSTIADQYHRSALRVGDVLLSIRGTVGRVCRVPQGLDGANITQDTARISVHKQILADYVEIYLRCASVQHRLTEAMKGVAVRGVNIGDVRALQVAVPPRPEQDEIVRRVEALFKLAELIEKRVVAATVRAEKLTQAILAKAFRGELVPTEAELARREGRDYEPASVLLARIRASREAQPRASKRRGHAARTSRRQG